MKKTVFIPVIVLLLLLCGCKDSTAVGETLPSAAPTVESSPAPQTGEKPEAEAETEPIPEVKAGAAKPLRLPAVLTTLNRGDTVDVIGPAKEGYEDYMVVTFGDKFGLVENQYLLMEGETEYVSWTGYTQKEAGLYDSCYLNGDSQLTVPVNTELKVLDEFRDCCLVEYNGSEYTVAKELVGKARVTGGSYGGGGSGGGSSGSTVDGGSIYLPLSYIIDDGGEVSGKATLRLNNTPLIIGLYDRGEELEVLERGEKTCRLLVFGLEAETESRFVRLEGDAPFEAWTGYSVSGARLYDNPWLTGDGAKLQLNTALEVLDELGDCYLVRTGDSEGYITRESISAEKTPVSGGYSGGGGSGGSWTEPKM